MISSTPRRSTALDPATHAWVVRGLGFGIVLGAAATHWVDYVVLFFVGIVIAQVVGPLLAMRAKNKLTSAR